MIQTKVGIIAGGGGLPQAVAAELTRHGRALFVVLLDGIADARWANAYPHASISIAKAGAIIRTLKEQGCQSILFLGKVARPEFTRLKPDLFGLKIIYRLARAARQGDDGLLRAILNIFEEEGFKIMPLQQAAGSLLGKAGCLTSSPPTLDEQKTIRRAISIIHGFAANHPGQGIIIKGTRILAVEDASGTDAMLMRVAAEIDAKGAILVKALRQSQESRVDLPTLGIDTVRLAHKVGLKGLAWAADEALLIDQLEMANIANGADIFLCGMETSPL